MCQNPKHLWSDDGGKIQKAPAGANVLINSDANVIEERNKGVSKLISHGKGMRKDQNDEKRTKRKKGKNKRTSRCVGSGLGPSPKYLGRSEVTNIVSLLISCFLIAAVAVIRVDKVASISRSLPYWVSRTAGQVKAHVSLWAAGQKGSSRDGLRLHFVNSCATSCSVAFLSLGLRASLRADRLDANCAIWSICKINSRAFSRKRYAPFLASVTQARQNVGKFEYRTLENNPTPLPAVPLCHGSFNRTVTVCKQNSWRKVVGDRDETKQALVQIYRT